MALIVQELTAFGVDTRATITFTYDDSINLIVNVLGRNDRQSGTLIFTMLTPRSFTRTLLPGESIDQPLVGANRIPYDDGLDYHGHSRFTGLTWVASFGF